MTFDYFYGEQSEQFSFYRIPKVLFTGEEFKDLSTEAKVLYGILLDRMSLSAKRGWLDDQGRVYIYYTIEEVSKELHCAGNKAMKLLSELENKVGLIQRKRQGLGKPNRIYVKNFIADTKASLESSKSRFKELQNNDSGDVQTTLQETSKSRGSNTDIRDTDPSDTDSIPSVQEGCDWAEYQKAVEHYFRASLDFCVLLQDYPAEKETLEGILSLLVDVCCSKRESIRVGKEEKPAAVVKSRFMELNSGDIRYVLQSLRENTSKIRDPVQYMTAVLYNAPVTKSIYYQAWANHDMAEQGG